MISLGLNNAYRKIGMYEITEEQKIFLQKCLLEMYKDVLLVCQKYGIMPYLDGGSALGAIRHEVLIPGDDDLYIVITCNDVVVFYTQSNVVLNNCYDACLDYVQNKIYIRDILEETNILLETIF